MQIDTVLVKVSCLQVESMFAWNVNGGKLIVIRMGTVEIQVIHDLWAGEFLPGPECVQKGDD